MSSVKKTEISFLKVNDIKLKTITDFLDLSLDEVVNASLYLGLYKIWLPIARIIDEFPDWNLDLEEETEKLHAYIMIIQITNKNIQKIEVLEKKFNINFSKKHFKSDTEHYTAFIDYIESHLAETKSAPSKQVKQIVKKVTPLKIKKTPQKDLVPNKKSTVKKYLRILYKSGIFVLFFISPILLILLISIVIFKYNYRALLQYQPVMLLLLVFVMILWGIVSGWGSQVLVRHYQNTAKDRRVNKEFRTKVKLRKCKFRKIKKAFGKETHYSKFKGTHELWYQQLEKFIESKNKDNI